MVRRAFLHHHNCLDPSLSSSVRLDPQKSQTMAAHAGHSHSHQHHHPPHETSHQSLPDCTLENAMKIIVDMYHQYAPRQDKDDCLSLKDLTELLKSQAPTFLAACNRSNPNYIPWLFKKADVDGNKTLTFEETNKVWALLAEDAHRISHNEDRCGPNKD